MMDDDKQTQINDQNYKTDHALISEKDDQRKHCKNNKSLISQT